MVGIRTALLVSVCAGLAWIAGQPDFARDMLTLDDSWKSRLQILVGRPSAPEQGAESEAELYAEVETTRPELPPVGAAPKPAPPKPEQNAAAQQASSRRVPSRDDGPRDDRSRDDRSRNSVESRAETRTATPKPSQTARSRREAVVQEPEVDRFLGEFVAVEGANLRTGPGVEHARIDVIGPGERLVVTGRTQDQEWYQVEHRGRTLYIVAETVRAERISTPSGSVSLKELAEDLAAMSRDLKRARFQEVLNATRRLRPEVEGAARWMPLQRELIRLELMAATSEIALSRMTDASLSLRRALAVDGSLELDPSESPPKLRRLLAQVRRSR